MALKRTTFFSVEVAGITPREDDSREGIERRAVAPAPSFSSPAEETIITHGEGLVLIDDLEALRLALSDSDEEQENSASPS